MREEAVPRDLTVVACPKHQALFGRPIASCEVCGPRDGIRLGGQHTYFSNRYATHSHMHECGRAPWGTNHRHLLDGTIIIEGESGQDDTVDHQALMQYLADGPRSPDEMPTRSEMEIKLPLE